MGASTDKQQLPMGLAWLCFVVVVVCIISFSNINSEVISWINALLMTKVLVWKWNIEVELVCCVVSVGRRKPGR